MLSGKQKSQPALRAATNSLSMLTHSTATGAESGYADLGALALSFEFFPPRSEEMGTRLWSELLKLELIRPSFVSVTCGADGGTRKHTHDIVARLALGTSLRPAAHMTCVGATREDVNQAAYLHDCSDCFRPER